MRRLSIVLLIAMVFALAVVAAAIAAAPDFCDEGSPKYNPDHPSCATTTTVTTTTQPSQLEACTTKMIISGKGSTSFECLWTPVKVGDGAKEAWVTVSGIEGGVKGPPGVFVRDDSPGDICLLETEWADRTGAGLHIREVRPVLRLGTCWVRRLAGAQLLGPHVRKRVRARASRCRCILVRSTRPSSGKHSIRQQPNSPACAGEFQCPRMGKSKLSCSRARMTGTRSQSTQLSTFAGPGRIAGPHQQGEDPHTSAHLQRRICSGGSSDSLGPSSRWRRLLSRQ